MQYFDRIIFSEGASVKKTIKSKECEICHYWYFLNKQFKFQPYVCKRYHNLLMMSMNLSDISTFNNKCSDYHCIVSGISKSKTTK